MFYSLRDILFYIRTFYNTAFKAVYFLIVVIMISLIIYFNYHPVLSISSPSYNWFQHFLFNYFLYLVPFATAFLLQCFFYQHNNYFKQKWFWIILLLAPAFFSFRVNFTFLQAFIQQHWQGQEQKYWLTVFNLLTRTVVIIPVLVVWYIKDRSNMPLYGFKRTVQLQPYILLLAMMLPLLIVASNNPAFLKQYPRAISALGNSAVTGGWRLLLFELSYLLDFFSIEFFFRGFLIMAFVRICGMQIIIPAACFYCCIHLGKPMPEAISSFWGGLLLGIISYHTKSIWGGLLIHVGSAIIMELLAFCQLHHL